MPDAADSITEDPRPGPRLVPKDFVNAVKRFQKDQMTDHAAALTYYSLLSLFPALLAAVSVLGVFGQESLVPQAVDYLQEAGVPETTIDPVRRTLENILANRSTALTSLVVGLAIALNGASGAFGAAGRALNVVQRVQEGRNFVRRKASDIVYTLVVIALALVTLVLIFLGGQLAGDVLGALGLGETATTLWRILRWPAALLVAMLIYALIYFGAPNVKVERFQFISPGAIFGVVVWLIASGLFFLYVANFSNYSATYGTFAGAVILLIWLWVTNLVFLFGGEMNTVIDLRRSPELPEGYDGPPLPVKVPPKD